MEGIEFVARSADFAAKRHAAQRRKGEAAEPYVNHLAEVAMLLAANVKPVDAELVAAGWLHDTIEDVGVTAEELIANFGARVASIVVECTDNKSLPKPERKRLQEVNAPKKSREARLVKIADKTSNLRALRQSPPNWWPPERVVEYLSFSRRVVAGCRGLAPELEALFDEACAELEAIAIKNA